MARAAAILAASAAFTCAPLAQAEEVASVNTNFHITGSDRVV
ncbi:MAG TPA: CREA signal peptide protein, partial [Paraburkholderia sp.]|nr:CREA signal peptide protein [Paraburkholderia sp.]